MRVINPKKRETQSRAKKTSKFLLLIPAVIILGAAFAVFKLTQSDSTASDTPAQTQSAVTQNIQVAAKKGTLKTFTGEEFKNLYNNFAYPNTALISEKTPITDNEAADDKIREVAVSRGYQLRGAPVTDAFVNVGKDYELQQRAAQPWLDMVEAAKADGISIGLTAAYRSAEDQKTLFLGQLNNSGISPQAIGTGYYNAQISQILRTTAIPGYSRHHTGYTVDIACNDMPNSSFEFTNCFEWLSANNYEHAKKFGWIPSYPKGTENQGPDPESWEYVWVGVDAVTE